MSGLALHRSTVTLALACGLAAALVYHVSQGPPYETAAQPAAAADIAMAPVPSWRMPARDSFASVLARPLFSESRRPPRKEPEAAPVARVAAPEELEVVITGVILTPVRRMALVRQGRGETLYLSEGDELDGWRLVEIAAEHVEFDRGERRLRAALQDLPEAADGDIRPPPKEVAETSPDAAEATVVTVDGRQIEVLPEHFNDRGEGSILAAIPDPES